MKRHFFKCLFMVFLLLHCVGTCVGIAQIQGFETGFRPLSYPQEFLPNWYANEVSDGSSRIFLTSGHSRSGGKALAVQPISTFNGKIWIRLSLQDFDDPEVAFYAKSTQNGSGTRPVLVFFSWAKNFDGEFTEPLQIGENAEFANENQDWRKFVLQIPGELRGELEVVLSIDVRYGPGSGSAARWLMDDFEFGDFVVDDTPPEVLEVKGYGSNSLLLRFSEKLDPVFSVFPIAYELDGKNPESAELRRDSVVVLTFSEKLEQQRTRSITLRNLWDLEGNFLKDTTVQFMFADPTDIPRKALVINELMPAPRADQDLPNVEYIELFHAGENEFRLEGVRLSNSRNEAILDEYWIKPGEFLILAPESQSALLLEYGSVVPMKTWPTLLNSGDQITLKTVAGSEIDQISYGTATWGGSDFSGGGYSLEVPNPGFLCNGSSQLGASQDPKRGTPGSRNSIYTTNPELILSKLKSAYFVDSLQIRLVFSGPVLPDFASENVLFSPSLLIDSLAFLTEKEVNFLLKSPAESGKRYDLEIVGVKDCFGNLLPEQPMSIVLPENPLPGELLINELLFNPRAGDPKFVEIKNSSEKYLSIENWALADANALGMPGQASTFGDVGSILEPGGYLAITTDSTALQLAYPKSAQSKFLEVKTLPSYPISGGTVFLLSPAGEMVESFTYDEDLHHPLLRDPKGVSLERISHLTPASIRMNWQSASGSEEFATPGRRNSQTISGEFESERIEIEPEVFDPEGSFGLSFTSIRYQLDQSGWVGTFKIYSAAGQLIQTLAQNQILGTSGLFTWAGIDSTGKLVRAGYYVLVVELYEPDGKTDLIRRTMVVATRL